MNGSLSVTLQISQRLRNFEKKYEVFRNAHPHYRFFLKHLLKIIDNLPS